MADETSAFVIPLHHIPPKKRKAKPSAPRAKASRPRKKSAPEKASLPDSEHLIPLDLVRAELEQAAAPKSLSKSVAKPASPAPQAEPLALPPPGRDHGPATPPQQPQPLQQDNAPPARQPSRAATPRHRISAALLTLAALALAIVGMTMNGWFARSLGSTDASGWLFLAIGVAADLVALTLPSIAARLWQQRQRATSLAAWAVWLMTFAFAITAGIGFASVNIADVTASRAARVTPVLTMAQTALADAMTARDRECKGGVGKFCREREAVVNERRHALDSAMAAGAATADPQSEAAVRLVAWVSAGTLHPTGDDFAMLRLVLLALLPQIGGILLMVGRSS
ncbi:MAG: hypothetical protein JOY90_02950 [Bradyrhizobium sp.]|uniref:hypothetical protein n=1 Tax=Bradyrhizobium sp. TaxID=376 RepID=UPI001D2938AC|nr:hypothetical protein [Bradyrhizobium sp.]MBV9559410.1 hypothetical protein [Bradyrhizobium sp.]